MFSPETIWDNIITDVDGFYCSTIYNNIPFGPGRFKIKDVVEMDCSDFDGTVAVSEATAYIKEIIEFSNDVKIIAKFWQDSQSIATPLWCKMVASYNGQDQSVISHSMLLRGRGYGGYDFDCEAETLRKWGCKLVIINDFFDANSSPTYGLTPMFYLHYRLFIGAEFVSDQATYKKNDLTMINQDSFISIGEDSEISMPFLNDEIAPFSIDHTITDLDAFITALEAIGGEIKNPYNTGGMEDPNQDIDPSQPGGGGGSYNPAGFKGGYTKDSQPVDFPALPTNGALATGSIKAFVVSQGTVIQLFQELWSTALTDLATWQKLFSEPMEALISLNCLPFLPTASGDAPIHLGNIDFNDTVRATPVTNQYKQIDCGKYTLKPFWGSALDTAPYTKVEIFVPFVGIREIKPEDCVGLELHLKYNVDVLTGNLTAQLKCGQSVLYKWQGNCKGQVPLSSTVNAMLEQLIKSAGGIAGAAVGGNAAGAAVSAAVNVAFAKAHISRSGDISGSVGLLDEFLPYLIVHRPIQSLAKDFRKFKGYPSNITASLASVKGYTEVEHINLSVPGATDEELEEIRQLLSDGVLM